MCNSDSDFILYYNLLLCFISLEMHVRLIYAIKFYLLTYLSKCSKSSLQADSVYIRAGFKGPRHSHQQRASHQTIHILFLANDTLGDYDLVVVHYGLPSNDPQLSWPQASRRLNPALIEYRLWCVQFRRTGRSEASDFIASRRAVIRSTVVWCAKRRWMARLVNAVLITTGRVSNAAPATSAITSSRYQQLSSVLSTTASQTSDQGFFPCFTHARSIFTEYFVIGAYQTTIGSVAEWLACWTQAQKSPGFKSQSRRCRVTVLGKLFTPIVPVFTKQQNW